MQHGFGQYFKGVLLENHGSLLSRPISGRDSQAQRQSPRPPKAQPGTRCRWPCSHTALCPPPRQQQQQLALCCGELWGVQDHTMGWVGRALKNPLVPNPLPWAGTRSASPGCTKTHCSNLHGHFHCSHSKKFLLNI